MAKKEWQVTLEDGEHTVIFERNYSGKKITVDHVETKKMKNAVFEFGGEYPFIIGNHKGYIIAKTNFFSYKYDLIIDGKSVSTGNEVQTTIKAAEMGVGIYRIVWGDTSCRPGRISTNGDRFTRLSDLLEHIQKSE